MVHILFSASQTRQTSPATPRLGALTAVGAALCATLAFAGCSDDADDGKTSSSIYDDVATVDAGAWLPPRPTVTLCNPCDSSLQCDGEADVDAHCVDYGDLGGFCGGKCATAADCKEGYACADVKSVEGESVKQCVRKGEGGAQFGTCECSEWAAATSQSTQCIAKTKAGASCPGTRRCSGAGLTACTAPEPSDETCDGVDNDCDGQTDEDTCADAPVCQQGVCHVALGCQYVQKKETCDDGDACTKDDACFDGACTGDTLDCDDGKICTKDWCDKAKGCQHADTDGADCDDGVACTVGDACKAGLCVAGGPKDCNDGNPCTIDVCHQASGTCINDDSVTDPCDDGNACTEGDACKGGVCKPGTAKVCDDKDNCTKDSCVPATGCVNLPTGVSPCVI
jgi:hypothetical protein